MHLICGKAHGIEHKECRKILKKFVQHCKRYREFVSTRFQLHNIAARADALAATCEGSMTKADIKELKQLDDDMGTAN
eukprot:4828638-Ditylum_brightwellii.AAC.1